MEAATIAKEGLIKQKDHLANSIKLKGDQEGASRELNKEDWSASNERFQICVAAVHSDVDTVIALMQKQGASGVLRAEDYRAWPVFKSLRGEQRFADAFQEVFGIPIIRMSRSAAPEIATGQEGEDLWGTATAKH